MSRKQSRSHKGKDKNFSKAKNKGSQTPAQKSNVKANIWGWHAVIEAWHNPKRQIHSLFLTDKAAERFEPEIHNARKNGLKRPDAKLVQGRDLDEALNDSVHQGIALNAGPLPEMNEQDLIIQCEEQERSVIVMLDQVTDPHNVGAIIRSASAFGANGLVVQTKHAPSFDGVMAKTACGGLEHLSIASATNLSRALEQFKEAGYFVVGLDERGQAKFEDFKTHEKLVLVLGAEGPGMRRLVAEHCDGLVALPTVPPIYSLNVSNAAAVALYALKG